MPSVFLLLAMTDARPIWLWRAGVIAVASGRLKRTQAIANKYGVRVDIGAHDCTGSDSGVGVITIIPYERGHGVTNVRPNIGRATDHGLRWVPITIAVSICVDTSVVLPRVIDIAITIVIDPVADVGLIRMYVA